MHDFVDGDGSLYEPADLRVYMLRNTDVAFWATVRCMALLHTCIMFLELVGAGQTPSGEGSAEPDRTKKLVLGVPVRVWKSLLFCNMDTTSAL